MAYRAAVAGQTRRARTTVPYRSATPPAATTWAATSGPLSGLPAVRCLARPATDIPVNEPDAAQHTNTDRLSVATSSARRAARVGGLPAPRVPTGTGPLVSTLGVGLDRAARGFTSAYVVGCSSVSVRTVTGTRSCLDRFR